MGINLVSLLLPDLYKRGRQIQFRWANANATNVGTGGTSLSPYGDNGCQLNTGTDPSSSAMAQLYPAFMHSGAGNNVESIDFGQKIIMDFDICFSGSDAQCVRYVQLKTAVTIGALAAAGFGLKLANLAVYLEAYDSQIETVDASTVLVANRNYHFRIIHTPTTSVTLSVDDSVVATSTREPSGVSAIGGLIASIANGVTGGVNAYFAASNINIWQDR